MIHVRVLYYILLAWHGSLETILWFIIYNVKYLDGCH